MLGGGRRERTTISADDMAAVLHLETRRAAEVVQNCEGGCDALSARFPVDSLDITRGETAADFAHAFFQSAAAELLPEDGENHVEYGTVGLRKNLLGLAGYAVGGVRFPESLPRPGLFHEAVTLESGEVGPDGVVGEAKGSGEIIYRLLTGAQFLENSTARALENARAPAGLFHWVKYGLAAEQSKHRFRQISRLGPLFCLHNGDSSVAVFCGGRGGRKFLAGGAT